MSSGLRDNQQVECHAETPCSSEPGQWPEGSLVLPAHKLVLIAQSEFFKARFTSSSCMSAGEGSRADGRQVLVMRDVPEQHAAIRAFVRFMYCADMEAAVAADPMLLYEVRCDA